MKLERPRTLDHLVALGAIAPDQARIVIAQQQHLEEHAGQHRRVGELLLDNAFVTREVLRGALGELGIGNIHGPGLGYIVARLWFGWH